MLIREMILPEFDEEMANTRKMLDQVPNDKFDYKPHEKSMALGRLASHVAEMAMWTKMTMETEVLNFDEQKFEPYVATSREQLLGDFDKTIGAARASIENASDEELLKTWTMIWGGQTIMALPRYRIIQSMVLNHSVHHRAQLGVYLRLNDIAIPGAYGPSADEMAAMAPPVEATA